MKYLDENIEITISGITTPQANTYPYIVRDINENVLFVGNTFLNNGQTQKTFDITDILSNLKWKGDIVKPLSSINNNKVNVVNQYYLTLTVSGTTYTSDTIDVAFIYRYPNRKSALEAELFDDGTSEGVAFQNCLQGAKNGVYELYPHVPYKNTSEYGFGIVAEVASGGSYNTVLAVPLDIEGELYLDNSLGYTYSGATSVCFTPLSGIFGAAKESIVSTEVETHNYEIDPDVDVPLYISYIDVEDPENVPTSVTVWTDANIIKHYALNQRISIDIEMEMADGGNIYISHNQANNNTYIHLGGSEFTAGTVHVEFQGNVRGDNMVFMIRDPKISKGGSGNTTYLTMEIPNQIVGAAIYSDTLQEGVTETDVINLLMFLGRSQEEGTQIYNQVYDGNTTMIFSGSTAEVDAVIGRISGLFDSWREEAYGGVAQNVAIIDKGCLSKYYLLWQDRYGGYQSQPFEKTETFSEDFSYEEMKDYQNRRRNINIKVQPKWKIQTDWLEEKYYPYYESIFVSPYVLLYDTEEDKSYNVIATAKNYTEKTWKNQRKFFNLELELEQNKLQNIIY